MKARENLSCGDAALVTPSQPALLLVLKDYPTPVVKLPAPRLSPSYCPAPGAKKADLTGGGGAESSCCPSSPKILE